MIEVKETLHECFKMTSRERRTNDHLDLLSTILDFVYEILCGVQALDVRKTLTERPCIMTVFVSRVLANIALLMRW